MSEEQGKNLGHVIVLVWSLEVEWAMFGLPWYAKFVQYCIIVLDRRAS